MLVRFLTPHALVSGRKVAAGVVCDLTPRTSGDLIAAGIAEPVEERPHRVRGSHPQGAYRTTAEDTPRRGDR